MSCTSRRNEEAAYITVVEGPSPEFSTVNKHWTSSLAEGPTGSTVATCEMRTLNGQALVDRCRRAWQEGRPARLDYPRPSALGSPSIERAEVDIVAARWQRVDEGQKLILWVKTDHAEELGVKQ